MQVAAPKSVPAGKAGAARVDAGKGNKTCSLTVRSGKVQQGPFRSTAKPAAVFNWTVPANARKGRWTLAFRCAKNSKGLVKAKAKTVAMTVTTARSGGERRLVKPGSLRSAPLRTFDFFGTPRGTDCAAAWNGYKSVRDETGYCTGYDTWYAFKLMGLPQFKDLGDHTFEWQMHAQLKGLYVGKVAIPRSIAWWRGTAEEPTRVAFVEQASPTSITVKEMNRTRWNVATRRTIQLGTKGAPDGYLSLPPLNIDNGVITQPPGPLGPLPSIGAPPVRGGGRTAEIVSTTYSMIGGRTSLFSLGYGMDNVFRAAHVSNLDRPFTDNVESGDVDGDGRADLVALTQAPAPPHYVVARSTGDGGFTQVVTPTPLAEHPSAWVVVDANDDRRADVVSFEGGTYVVAFSNGDGSFSRGAPVAIPAPGYFGRPVVGDFTGDGRADLLLGISLLVNGGNGTFTEQTAFGGSALWPGPTAGGDFDEDGKADVVTLVPPGSGTPEPGYYVSLSHGDGTFTAPRRFADRVPETHRVWTGDIDGDGHVDLVAVEHVSEAGEPRPRYVAFLGHGDGTFTRIVLATNSTFGSQVTTVGDFDGR